MIKTIAAATGIIMTRLASILFAARILIVDELVWLAVGYAVVVPFFVPSFVEVVRFGVVKPFGKVDGTAVFGVVMTCVKVVGEEVSAKVTDTDFRVVVTCVWVSLLISNGSKK